MKAAKNALLLCIVLIACNRQTYTGSIYLVGNESSWEASEACFQFIRHQAIPKEYLEKVSVGTELVVEEDQVVTVYNYRYGRRGSKNELTPFALRFDPVAIDRHIPFSIQRGTASRSYLGGEKPAVLVLPTIHETIAFQYFGLLSKEEFPGEVLDFDLHLIAPIYDSFTQLYLDYSDPLAPRIINGEAVRFSRTFDEMDANSTVTFTKTPLAFEKGGSLTYGYGYTGVPNWIQGPVYPKCPYSGEDMIFLASFDMEESRDQIAVEGLNFQVENDHARYFNKLAFWISGAIYIFINPKTKVVCYFLQTT